jgi:heterodisulfide reductase subunit C
MFLDEKCSRCGTCLSGCPLIRMKFTFVSHVDSLFEKPLLHQKPARLAKRR